MTNGHDAEKFTVPEWMSDHILEALGGRDYVVELMSTPRTGVEESVALYMLQTDMEHAIDLLTRLHEDGDLRGF